LKELEDDFQSLLGGKYKNEDDRESFEMDDGREVPLSALSSGQQELLPLALTMAPYLTDERNRLIYIEELEAHLFPTAQSQIVKSFVSALMRPKSRVEIVLTTHSPYVLATLN